MMPWEATAQQAAAPASDEDAQTLELAKKTQNPISDMISLPLENNLNFGYGAKDAPHSSSTSFDYDVIVIGSGFGGSVAALRVVEKGYSVAVLEAGKRWRDEDLPKTSWDLPKLPGSLSSSCSAFSACATSTT
jgi:hypothetical protein